MGYGEVQLRSGCMATGYELLGGPAETYLDGMGYGEVQLRPG